MRAAKTLERMCANAQARLSLGCLLPVMNSSLTFKLLINENGPFLLIILFVRIIKGKQT